MNRSKPLSRRHMLARGGAAAGALLLAPTFAHAMMKRRSSGDHLVCIFLRGGADALHFFPAYNEDAYHAARPTLAVGRPDDNGHPLPAIDLDGSFGLHPILAPLHPLYTDGDLAIVHAVGTPNESRSHFSAMDAMERGREEIGDGTGWIARHLQTGDLSDPSVLRAITTSALVPQLMWGARVTTVRDLGRNGLESETDRAARLRPLLDLMYQDVEAGLADDAAAAFEAIDTLSQFTSEDDDSEAPYDETRLADNLRTIARLLRGELGIEVACVDVSGWDTHAAQGLADGSHPDLMASVAQNLAAFREDLGDAWNDTTVVVFTEFGRRLRENGALGTDHGHGGAMIVAGGGVQGGRVITEWPGLDDDDLVGPGDLAGTIDYRDVFAEILRKRRFDDRSDLVFPGHQVTDWGIVNPR